MSVFKDLGLPDPSEASGDIFSDLGLEAPPIPEQDGALTRGAKNAWNSIQSGASLLTGDTENLARLTAERDAYRRANPGTPEGNELMAAWNRGEGVGDAVSNVAGEMKKDWQEAPNLMGALRATGKNLSAMGGGIVEQMPNMVAPMVGMLVGGATGAATPVPGAMLLGGWAGASAGNTAIESGEQIDRALAEANINPQDTTAVQSFLAKEGDRVLGQAATKGSIIGAVDVATMGLGHLLLSAPGKAAVKRAIASGINPTDEAAIKAAVLSDPVFLASQKGGQALARNAGVAALEPAGEFTGEYVGQGVATDEWDTKGAALEALSSLGQSAVTFAGQKGYEALTSPLRRGVPAPQDGTGDVTPEDLDAGAADMASNLTAFETLPDATPMLGYDPVVIVPTQDGGTTTIDRRDGPLSDAAADAVESGVTGQMLANQSMLVPFASRNAAQQALDNREDAARLQIVPHPRVAGRFAIVPRDRLSLQAMDEANARQQQLESEDGNAPEMATLGDQGQSANRAGGLGNGGSREGEGGLATASGSGAGQANAVYDVSLEDSAIDELAPAPVQPVADMPGVQAAREQRLAQARAEAEARGAILVDEEASVANPAPSEAQINAGNYKKGHVKIGPLDVSVENPVGSTRKGPGWETTMSAHYGYVKRTVGADGDQVDVFIKEGTANDFSGQVYVVDQFNPATGRFDEHKAMVGYGSAAEAAAAYDAHFTDKSGPTRRRAVVTMPLSSFTKWAKAGDTTRPLSQAGKAADEAQAEIEQSTGKLSRARRQPGETAEQYQARAAAEANQRRQRRTAPAPVTEKPADATLAEVLGDGAAPIEVAALPKQGENAPGQISQQVARNIEQIARLFGKKVVFFTQSEEGQQADGFWVRGNTIYINAQSSVTHLRILGHELTHAMRKQAPEAYDRMFAAVKDLLTDDQIRAHYLDYKGEALEGEITDAMRDFVAEEWMADLSGNRFAESSFWESVFQKIEGQHGSSLAKSIINKLRMAFVSAINKLVAAVKGNQFAVDMRVAQDLEAIRDAIATGFADYAAAVKRGAAPAEAGGAKFSGLKMEITREDRELADKTKLTRDELATVSRDAKKFGLPAKMVEMEVRRIKARFPESAGWSPLQFLRVDPKTMAKKAKADNPLPSDAIFFVEQPYRFHLDGQGKDNKLNRTKRVKDLAAALAGEISGKYMAAQQGDKTAQVIMRQSDWYQALRGKLRATFGGFGDFLAQLLGPTSANNPVEPNFKYAVEALKMATSGKWDNMFREVFAWKTDMEAAAANLDATIAAVRAEGVKSAKDDPRVKAAVAALKDASQYKGTMPVRENGKMFGMASSQIIQILGETWGDKAHGDAPKTKNYYQNIMGRTFEATIDVWAARTLRRLANDSVGDFPRIPPVAESAVSGQVLVDNATSGAEFGFGQDVFRQAAEDLKASGIDKFKDVTPDAVQAMVWFIEKETWATRNWTTKVGEEGSIEHEMLLAGFPDRKQVDAWRVAARAGKPNPDTKAYLKKGGAFNEAKYERDVARWEEAKAIAKVELARIEKYPDRFVAGVTMEIPGGKPADGEMASLGREIEAAAAGDKVIALRAQTSTGEFMGDFERTLDVELVARNGYDAVPLWNKLVEIGDREGQQAVFLSRVLREDEVADTGKHRPGVELYFAKPITLEQAKPLMDLINEAGVHGMTMVTEGRRNPSALAGQNQPITGIRMQHIPEFMLGFGYNVSMANRDIESAVAEAEDRMDDLVLKLKKEADVATVARHWYETRVHFYGNDSRIAGSPAGQGDGTAWAGQRISEGLEGADRFARDGAAPLAARRAELQVSRGGAAKLSTRRSDAARDERAGGVDAQTSGSVPDYGQAAPGAVSAVGRHYSAQERQSLDGRYYGTGANGREADRVRAARDPRLKERIYFYVNAGNGITPEQNVGSHAHDVRLNNLYDANADTWLQAKLGRDFADNDAWLNAFESAVIDNGFDGYVSDFGTQRAAVLLGRHNVKVAYVGQNPTADATPIQREAVAATPIADRVAADRRLPAGRMSGSDWKRMVPEATMLDAGKDYYKDDVVRALRGAKMSPARRQADMFADDFATKRTAVSREIVVNSKGAKERIKLGNVASDGRQIAPTKQALQNFWDWYGQGPVDDKGRPVLLYHSTNGDVSVFETGRETTNNYGLLGDVTTTRAGIFATPDLAFSQEYLRSGVGQNVMPIYMALQNPVDLRDGVPGAVISEIVANSDLTRGDFYHVNAGNTWELFDDTFGEKVVAALKAAGYDGAILTEDSPGGGSNGGETYVAFGPTQIKSATGNVGTFDPANPDIRFSPSRRFYSQLARAFEQAPDKVFGKASQVKLWLAGNKSKLGVKDDEIQWTGINDWLDLQQKVTKADVLNYLQQNGVQVEEVLKGKAGFDETNPQLPPDSTLSVEPSENDRWNYQVQTEDGEVIGYGDSFRSAVADAYSARPDFWEKGDETKYSNYTLPGGENYRELLLTLPEKSGDEERAVQDELKTLSWSDGERRAELQNKLRQAEASRQYRSSHWQEPNILAHVRFNDRTDADGNKVLFIEELQSDAGQDKRKGKTDWKAPFIDKTEGWLDLGIKRMIAYAVEHGYDKIAFVTGEQSAERYDLSKQVGAILYSKNMDGTYDLKVNEQSGRVIKSEDSIALTGIEDLVGKEIATKIEAGAGEDGPNGRKILRGENLKVGGEGMKTFYDQIVPQRVREVLKKLGGGKVEIVPVYDTLQGRDVIASQIPGDNVWGVYDRHKGQWLESWENESFTSDPENAEIMGQKVAENIALAIKRDAAMVLQQPGFTITPEMREKVAQGQPLFSLKRTEAVQWMYANRQLPRVPGEALIAESDARFKQIVDLFLKEMPNESLMGMALPATPMPSVLHMLGAPNQWVGYHGSIINKVFGWKHADDFDGLSIDQVNQLLRSPMMVLKTADGEFEVVTDHAKDGKLITFALLPNQSETEGLRPGQKLNITLVKSAYALPWEDYLYDGKKRPGIKSRLVGPLGRKLLYADHIKFVETTKALSAPPTSGQTRELLPASPAKARVEKGLSDKTVRSYGDLVNFIDTLHKGAVEDKPMFSLRRRIDQVITNVDHAVDGLSNMPDQFNYLKDRYLALGRIARVDEIVNEIRQAFTKTDPVNKKAVYDYLTTKGATTAGIPDPTIRAMAGRIKKAIEYTGDALVARGLLDQQARDHYRDQYLPRMYLRHMLNDQDFKVIGMGKKPSDMGYLKHRKDIPDEIREVVLGEIKDPAFLSANAIGRAMRDVALLDWMGQISQNNDWVFPEVFATYQGKKVTAYWLRAEADRIELQIPHYTDPAAVQKAKQRIDDMRQLANQTLGAMKAIDHKVFKQIPDTRRYGLLRGMWIRKEIFDDIMGASQIVNADPTWFEDWFGFGGKGTQLTQWWKFTKVALNPPGQIRNFISNMVMLQLSGVGLHRLPIRLIQAARDISNNGKYWQVAKKYGVTESTFTAQEMYRIKRDLIQLEAQQGKLSGLRWLMAAGAKFLDGVSNLYQFSEALGKTIKIIDEMEKGRSEAEAAIEAQKWLFDYSLVPQSVRIARNAPVGMPFLTYQVKVLPRLMEVAAKYPWRFLPWAGLLYGMQAAVAAAFGVDDDDLEKLKQSLPKWLQDRGHTVVLPWKDQDGRVQVADVGYFFPWTWYSTMAKHAADGKVKDVLAGDIGGMFSAPVIGAGAALISNYDNFTKRPIYNEHDPLAYQAAAIANYSYDLMAPPFLSSHGVVSPMGLFDKQYGGKLTNALSGTTNKFGDPKATEAQAISALFGANFYGMDPEHSRITNLQVMNGKVLDAERQLKMRLRDQGLTPEQRQRYITDYQERIKELSEEMMEYAQASEVPPQLRTTR